MHRRAFLRTASALTVLAAPVLPLRALAQDAPLTGILTEGDPNAPVTVIEYASLTCPHCAAFHKTVYPELKRDYIDTGKIKLELREVYFDRFGLWGAMLARCGGESRYFGFVSLLLEKQREWTAGDDALAEMKRMGRMGGLTDAQVEACMGDVELRDALIENFKGFQDDPRLTGTPTLIVGDEKVENPTFENLKTAIDAELGS